MLVQTSLVEKVSGSEGARKRVRFQGLGLVWAWELRASGFLGLLHEAGLVGARAVLRV